MKSQSATYDKTVTLRANTFKRSRYKFASWAKTKTGKVAYKNKAKVKNLAVGRARALGQRASRPCAMPVDNVSRSLTFPLFHSFTFPPVKARRSARQISAAGRISDF